MPDKFAKSVVCQCLLTVLFFAGLSSCATVRPFTEREQAKEFGWFPEDAQIIIRVDVQTYGELLKTASEDLRGTERIGGFNYFLNRTDDFLFSWKKVETDVSYGLIALGRYNTKLVKRMLKKSPLWNCDAGGAVFIDDMDNRLYIEDPRFLVYVNGYEPEEILGRMDGSGRAPDWAAVVEPYRESSILVVITEPMAVLGGPDWEKITAFPLDFIVISVSRREGKNVISGFFSLSDSRSIQTFSTVFRLWLFSISRILNDELLKQTVKHVDIHLENSVLFFDNMQMDNLENFLEIIPEFGEE